MLTAAALATLVPFTAAYSAALGIEAGAFAIGQSHLRAALLGSIGLCMCNVLEATLRGFGSMKPALRVTTLMVLLNIILDPLFIYGVGPFPNSAFAAPRWGRVCRTSSVRFYSSACS